MSNNPILLVHGAWHGGWAWDALVPLLRDAGRDVMTVDLPSAGHDPAALGDLAGDAAVVSAGLDSLDEPAVLVGHSYGGQVISQASASRDDVHHLVYVCAFMTDVGTSLLGALADGPPDWIEIVADGTAMRSHRNAEIFYGDVDADAAESASARLGLQSVASFADELTGAGWHEIPSTYVLCEQDRAIPPVMQEPMSQHADNVHRLDASHSPFLSVPDQVAKILLTL